MITLLGSRTEHAREGRLISPRCFCTRITLLAVLQTSESICVFCLCCVQILHFVLHAPKVISRGKPKLLLHPQTLRERSAKATYRFALPVLSSSLMPSSNLNVIVRLEAATRSNGYQDPVLLWIEPGCTSSHRLHREHQRRGAVHHPAILRSCIMIRESCRSYLLASRDNMQAPWRWTNGGQLHG